MSIVGIAQTPDGFNYQSVVRNGDGEIVANKEINFRFFIREGSTNGSVIYSETQLVNSNNYGVCSIKVGEGADASGTLSEINWGTNKYFLNVGIDINGLTSFIDVGTIELISVPYAMYSKESKKSDTSNVAKVLDQEVLYFTETDTLFAVKDRSGNIVFAVFPDGAKVFVNEGIKGNVGGFAVTGRNPGKAITEEDYILVTPDSTRVWVNEPSVKGSVGGFAVTGRNPAKGDLEPIFVLNNDSTRIYTRDTIQGFGVGNSKDGSVTSYLQLSPNNYFIGHEVAVDLTTGTGNSIFGYQAGKGLKHGNNNIFIGGNAGGRTSSGTGGGNDNIFIGDSAGYNTGATTVGGNENVFIGNRAGYNNTFPVRNVFIGHEAGYTNTGGQYNTYIGNGAGRNATGGGNTFIGGLAGGYKNVIGSGNVAIGYVAGRDMVSSQNIYIGQGAGYNNTGTVGGNIFIGYYAGEDISTENNRLEISNDRNKPPLIYGEFDNQSLAINGRTTNGYTFYVNGTASGSSAWGNTSDMRLKKEIVTIPNALNKVLELRGVNFKWKDDSKLGDGIQMGFIAQEAEKVIPEVVQKNDDTYTMQYAPITAVLVEAMKEQQSQIDTLKKENEELKKKLDEIIELLNKE